MGQHRRSQKALRRPRSITSARYQDDCRNWQTYPCWGFLWEAAVVEVVPMVRRRALESALSEVALALQDEDFFGGIWLDQRAGGVLNVAVTEGGVEAADRELASRGLSDVSVVRLVAFTKAQLDAWSIDALNILLEQGRNYMHSVSTDTPNNKVRVDLAGDTPLGIVDEIRRVTPSEALAMTVGGPGWVEQDLGDKPSRPR